MKETCQSNNVKNKRKILADAGTGFCGQESVEEGTVMGVVSKDSSTGETSKGEQPAGENLLEGQYDEIASAASFQQALIEWRAGQKVNGNEEAADVVPSKCSKIRKLIKY